MSDLSRQLVDQGLMVPVGLANEVLKRLSTLIVTIGTIAHADFDHGTYCCDGMLIARHHDISGLDRLDLPLRGPRAQHRAEQQMKDRRLDPPAQPIRQPKLSLLGRMKRKLFRSRR